MENKTTTKPKHKTRIITTNPKHKQNTNTHKRATNTQPKN